VQAVEAVEREIQVVLEEQVVVVLEDFIVLLLPELMEPRTQAVAVVGMVVDLQVMVVQES
jgi:hypothetical protein